MARHSPTTQIMVNTNPKGDPVFRLCQRMDNHGMHTVSYRYFIPSGVNNYVEISTEEFEEMKGAM